LVPTEGHSYLSGYLDVPFERLLETGLALVKEVAEAHLQPQTIFNPKRRGGAEPIGLRPSSLIG